MHLNEQMYITIFFFFFLFGSSEKQNGAVKCCAMSDLSDKN